MSRVLLRVGCAVAAGTVIYGVLQIAVAGLDVLSRVFVAMAVGAIGFAVAWETTRAKRVARTARTEVGANINAKEGVRIKNIDVTTPAGSSAKVASDIKSEEGSVEIVEVHLRPTPKK